MVYVFKIQLLVCAGGAKSKGTAVSVKKNALELSKQIDVFATNCDDQFDNQSSIGMRTGMHKRTAVNNLFSSVFES